MKRFGLAIAFIMLCSSIWAQVPEAIKYQAVARDASGNVYENQLVQFEISVLEGSSTGTSIYTETHIDTTNAFGLVTLELGRGSVVSGDFTLIDWGSNRHFLEVNMDPTGGTNYQLAGTVELLSVPFALSAKTAEDDADTDPSNEIQVISKNGNQIELSDGGGFVIDEVNDNDADSTNEIQTLSISNDTIFLTMGGFAVLPVTVNNDNDSTNEIQDLQLAGNNLSITDNTSATIIDLTPYLDNTDEQDLSINGDTLFITNGDSVILPVTVNNDNDSTNEIQDLQLAGNNLSITDNTGATIIDLAPYLDNTDEQDLSINGDTLFITNGDSVILPVTVNNDNDSTNEIQDLQLAGNNLSITDNTGATIIDLAPYLDNTDEQDLSINGDTLFITNGDSVILPVTVNNDNDSTNEIQDLQLAGNNLSITDNTGATIIDLAPYLDNTDEQDLSINGDTLFITNGDSVILPVVVNNDNDSTNEIQDLQLAGNNLSITDNTGATIIDLAPYLDNTDEQDLSINGDTLFITNGDSVILPVVVNNDNDSTNEIQTLSRSNDTIYLTDGGNVALDDLSNDWNRTGDDIFYSDGAVGIGTNTTNAYFNFRDTLDASSLLGRELMFVSQTSNSKGTFYEYSGTATGSQVGYDIEQNTPGSNEALQITSTGGTRNFGITVGAGRNPFIYPNNFNAGVLSTVGGASSVNLGVVGVISSASVIPNTTSINAGTSGFNYRDGGATTRNVGLYGVAEANGVGDNIAGLFEVDNSTGNNYAIFADATGGTGTTYAGYFDGDVEITGNLNIVGNIAKGGGTFKIDHPLDPENKYLVHSFVESPDMMNVYNGNITTDANGFATVSLPDYFEASNKDFRYQLTVIGAFAQAIIKEKVSNNQFVIQTNQPNIEVSWQVTGIRNDNYSNKNRIKPEQEKEADNKGKYLHPEAYGKAKSTGIHYKPKKKIKFDQLSER